MSKRIQSAFPGERLGDPQAVRDLLTIVTGCRARWAYRDPAALWSEATPEPEPRTLTLERTPRVIRTLKDEGIIGTC